MLIIAAAHLLLLCLGFGQKTVKALGGWLLLLLLTDCQKMWFAAGSLLKVLLESGYIFVGGLSGGEKGRGLKSGDGWLGPRLGRNAAVILLGLLLLLWLA